MYKIIDGEVCRVEKIDSAEAKNAIETVLAQAEPLLCGIASCEEQKANCDAQIERYRTELNSITQTIDKDLCKVVAPEKATLLGF